MSNNRTVTSNIGIFLFMTGLVIWIIGLSVVDWSAGFSLDTLRNGRNYVAPAALPPLLLAIPFFHSGKKRTGVIMIVFVMIAFCLLRAFLTPFTHILFNILFLYIAAASIVLISFIICMMIHIERLSDKMLDKITGLRNLTVEE